MHAPIVVLVLIKNRCIVKNLRTTIQLPAYRIIYRLNINMNIGIVIQVNYMIIQLFWTVDNIIGRGLMQIGEPVSSS